MTDPIQALAVAAAALGGAASGSDQAPRSNPLQLVAEPIGTGVRLQVVGNSSTTCEARYELAVSGDTVRGSNRSVQRGTARLRPGVPATLATVTLAAVNPEGWSARLVVDPCVGPRYQQVKGNAG